MALGDVGKFDCKLLQVLGRWIWWSAELQPRPVLTRGLSHLWISIDFSFVSHICHIINGYQWISMACWVLALSTLASTGINWKLVRSSKPCDLREAVQNRHPNAYHPWGFSTRACIGSQFALFEAKPPDCKPHFIGLQWTSMDYSIWTTIFMHGMASPIKLTQPTLSLAWLKFQDEVQNMNLHGTCNRIIIYNLQ